MSGLTFAVVLAALVVAGLFILVTVVRNTYVCAPSEVLIFSGRKWMQPDGREIGFRCVRGGRAMRMPMIEVVDRMQLTSMGIELSVTNAFSRGGVPLNVVAVANIKIPSEEPLLHNALERFLGCTREQIIYVAKDTLEGNLRGVIAELTPDGSIQVIGFAFHAKDGETMAEPVRATDGFEIVRLKEHHTATPEDFTKDREQQLQQLLVAKQNEALSLYVQRLREASKGAIKKDDAFLKEPEAKDGGAPTEPDEEEGF